MSLTLLILISNVYGCLGGSGNNLHLGIQLLDESEKHIAPAKLGLRKLDSKVSSLSFPSALLDGVSLLELCQPNHIVPKFL